MKRILAVFLTLAMALNIAPVAAFAAADSDAASIVAVEETDETSSPQLDEETAKAIASDPFLQAAYAQTEQEQTGQAEVDTSNVSVSATNSFGQLLVNGLGMDGENGSDLSSESHVIEITMNGSTAMVKYIAKKDANLVVGIYTDDSEQEMIASGTVAVQATPDNTASSIVEVPLSGEVPEHYTVKGFLLDKEDHAPLCGEYTNAFYTENVEELEGATIDDFDSARAVNLDDDRTTNFGVVKQGVMLLQEDELENGAGENIVVLDDSENQIYQIENASTELLNLKQGSIIVCKYGENNLIIAHVADFEINGTTVTIYGDEDFQLEDVFSILKMDGENTTDEAIVDTETGDGKVSYIGTQEIETLDSTNEWEGKAEFSHVFKISTDDGKDEDSEEKPVSGSVEGTVSIKAAIKLKLRLCDDNKMVSLSFPMTEKFELEGAVEYKGEILKFPKITLPVYGCLSVGFEPQMVFKANASVAFKMESTQMIGFEWSQKDGTQDISEAPVTSINFKLSGSIYLGFDMAPKAELGVGKVSLVKLKFKAEAGFELSAEERLGDQGTGLDEIHGCKNCYEGELEFKITLGVSLKILLYEPKIEITPFSHSFGKAYASADYGDFGWGECPHVKYRLTLKAGKAGAGATVKIQSNDSDTSSLYTETTLDADGNSTVYLPGREYRIIADKGSMEFVKTIKLSRGITVDIDLEQGSTGGNPGTTEPDKPNPDTPDEDEEYNIFMGVLNIKKASVMVDYETADAAPWSTERDAVTRVNVDKSILRISRNALAQFANLKEVYLNGVVTEVAENAFANSTLLKDVYYAGTVAEWNAVQLGAGNDVLEKATIHCSDGIAGEPERIVASGSCGAEGDNLTWTLNDQSTLTISGNGRMTDYGSSWETPWCAERENVKNVIIKSGVLNIGDYAFAGFDGLVSITMPSSVIKIGYCAFSGCHKLTGVEIPSNVRSIGEDAFKGCTSLVSMTIPSNVGRIGGWAFAGCTELENVILSNNIAQIEKYTFSGCESLKNIVIPEEVRSIGNGAFRKCERLEHVVIPKSVTYIGMGAFRESGLVEITVPGTVQHIGKGAFANCQNLQNAVIQNGVQSISQAMFYGCKSLTSVTIPDSVTSIEGEDYQYNASSEKGAFEYCTNLKEITIPAFVTNIGVNAFYGCSSLTEVSIQGKVTEIGTGAFEDCTNLESISLPESVIKIGNYAFKSTALTGKFVIPSGVTKIGDGLFENCQKLTEVVIPDGITFIGPYAFKYTGITSFVIPDGIRTINVDTFYGTCLDRITIPVSVTAINPSAFGNEYVNGYVKEVHYTGTKSDWSRIWVGGANERLREATIHCTDGDIVPNTENSITTGTASTADSKFQATFANAKAGKEYVVLVSRSDSDPLNADNLIYINQITADADGELAVPFITAADAAEMTYVVACAQDDATVDPDQPVEPGQPDQPDQPGEDKPSSGGGDGGGAIILIGGVAAVAAVAGVVLLMPVKVEGTVKLADQPVANATVQVLKGDAVKAETVTDANGHFTVKVKRGGYTLRVQWTDASGQPVTRTVDFKAPNANLNVAA